MLERLYADRLAEQAARLAHHAFRGEVWGKALVYLRQAGTEAAGPSLDAVLGGPESPATLWWTGEHERAATVGQRDLAIAGDFRGRGHQAYAMLLLGEVASLRQPSEAEQGAIAYRDALALAQELEMPPLVARHSPAAGDPSQSPCPRA